ncbi:MAG: hypothetical protein ACRCRT_01220, partial [Cetobacterium somerae]
VPNHYYEDFVNKPDPRTIHVYVERDEFEDKYGDVKFKSDSFETCHHPKQEECLFIEDIRKAINDKTKFEIFILHVYHGFPADSLISMFKISRQRIHQIKMECLEKIRAMEGYEKWD